MSEACPRCGSTSMIYTAPMACAKCGTPIPGSGDISIMTDAQCRARLRARGMAEEEIERLMAELERGQRGAR